MSDRALRLADRLTISDYYEFDAALHCPQAATELRRLHALNAELVAENEALLNALRKVSMNAVYVDNGECSLSFGVVREVDAAIAKATGEQT